MSRPTSSTVPSSPGAAGGTADDPTGEAVRDASPAASTVAPAAAAATDAGAAVAEDRPEDYLPLVGRWVRTDSPYVIEIRGVGRDGSLEAAYFNPRPIRVSRAEAQRDSDTLQVFVELRDVNYPGSTYTLVYNRAQDLLQGIYFQAVEGQRFDVSFARLRPEDFER